MEQTSSPLTPYGLGQHKQSSGAQLNAPRPVETGLFESLFGALSVAHDRVTRLDGLADRIFGPVPEGAVNAPQSSIADGLMNSVQALNDRLNSALSRLERLA